MTPITLLPGLACDAEVWRDQLLALSKLGPVRVADVHARFATLPQMASALLAEQPGDVMQSRREEAATIFRRVGITFAVYGAKDEDGAGTERLIPFDLIPRIIPADEWRDMERGLAQRVTALNRFIHDVYHGQEILKAGIVPADQIERNAQFRPEIEALRLYRRPIAPATSRKRRMPASSLPGQRRAK